MNNRSMLYTPHAYTYNIWLFNVVLHFFSPLSQPQWCSPLCNTLFIAHQSDPPASLFSLPLPTPPLSPPLSTSLYKANETEVGPLFTGGARESRGGHTGQGREAQRLHQYLCVPECMRMCTGVSSVCLSVQLNMHFIGTSTDSDTSTEERE